MDRILSAALEPLRDALLAAARRDAKQERTRAEAAAAARLGARARCATEIRTEARARGAADSAAVVAAERARAGRRARSVVLHARAEEYRALRSAAREAVDALRHDDDYPRIRQRLTDVVRGLLGAGVSVRDGECGGVIGEVPGRRADYSLAGFAERALDAILAEEDQPSGSEWPQLPRGRGDGADQPSGRTHDRRRAPGQRAVGRDRPDERTGHVGAGRDRARSVAGRGRRTARRLGHRAGLRVHGIGRARGSGTTSRPPAVGPARAGPDRTRLRRIATTPRRRRGLADHRGQAARRGPGLGLHAGA